MSPSSEQEIKNQARVQVVLSIPVALKQQWVLFAANHNLSLSNCIRTAMEEYITPKTANLTIEEVQKVYVQLERIVTDVRVQRKIDAEKQTKTQEMKP